MGPSRMPELSASDIAKMHADNASRATLQDERMQRIEGKQDRQADLLANIREMLARIDERTKKFEDIEGVVEKLDGRVCEVEESTNKAKGMGLLGSLVLGGGELGHIIWTVIKGH
jgi:DNA repair exonuclease SbcCD ATPase subunit